MELERLFDSVLVMRTVSVRFHTSDELIAMALPSVEGLLFEVQSMRSRLDGQEATLHSAIGVLQGANGPRPPRPRPHPAGDPDAGSGSGPDGSDNADAGSGPGDGTDPDDPNPNSGGGGPSGRAERERLARAQRLEAHPDVAAALNAGRISTEQADAIMKAGLPADVKSRLLVDAVCQATDETLAAIKTAIVAADGDDAERKFRRQRNRRKGLCGVDEHGMTWININFDPIIGAAFMEMFDREVRRQFQIDKLEPNPLKLRSPYKIGADACTVLFGLCPENLTIQDITNDIRGQDINSDNADPANAGPNDASSSPSADSSSVAGSSVVKADSRNGSGSGRGGGHRVNLTMDISTFGHPQASAYTQTGEPIPVSILNKILCNAEILLWITDTTSQNPGRYQLETAEPYATEIQKQCLTIRDRHCVWKGCNMRATRCDAHHLTFTREGGKTSITNLALLCPTHHTRLHQMGAHLHQGHQPHQWVLEHDLTGNLIDKWTNPPPRSPPKPPTASNGTARTVDTEHDASCPPAPSRVDGSSARSGDRPKPTDPSEPPEPDRHEPIDLPPRW